MTSSSIREADGRRRAHLAWALLLTAAACASPGDGGSAPAPASPPPPSRVTPDEANTVAADKFNPVLVSACGDASGTEHVVFFTCSRGDGPPITGAVVREVGDADPATGLVRALLAGPTDDEQAAGFVSSFGPRTSDVTFSVRVDDGVALLDLAGSVLEVEGLFVPVADVAQVVSTLGRFAERVAVLVEGAPLCRVLEEC